MNNLKFRAYHKTEKKVYSVSVLDFDNQDVMLSDNGETFYDVIPMEEVEIMQSTGLFDKNGKEIFEGDIVQDNCDKIFIVEKYNNGCEFVLREKGKGGINIGIYSITTMIGTNKIFFRGKVLGNKYENSELLKS